MLTQNDPDHGTYTYTHDALGQKLSEVYPERICVWVFPKPLPSTTWTG